MDINRTTRTIAVDCRKVWTFVFSQLNSRQLHRITSHFLSVKRKSHSKNAEFLRNRIKMFALTPYRTDRALSNFANDTSYQQFLNREQKMIEVWKNRNSVFNPDALFTTLSGSALLMISFWRKKSWSLPCIIQKAQNSYFLYLFTGGELKWNWCHSTNRRNGTLNQI